MSLFDDALNLLGEQATVLSKQETNDLLKELLQQFPFTRWARIDWAGIKHYHAITSAAEVIPFLREYSKDLSEPIFVIWDEGTLPEVKSDLRHVLRHIEDVTIVSFDTWLFSPSQKYVIEFYHEGEVTIGWSD